MKVKKSLSPVIASLGLLTVVSLAIVSLFSWYQGYQSQLEVEISSAGLVAISIERVMEDGVYLKNYLDKDIEVESIKIDETDCQFNGLISKGVSFSNFGNENCTNQTNRLNEIVIVTSEGLFSKSILIGSGSGSSVLVNSNNQNLIPDIISSHVSFESFADSDSCGTDSKIFSVVGDSNSHAAIPSLNEGKSKCFPSSVSNGTTTISFTGSCSANYVVLFYVNSTSQSHAYTSSDSGLTPICLSADVFDINMAVSYGGSASSTSVCMGSIVRDDVQGGSIGECNLGEQAIPDELGGGVETYENIIVSFS